MAIDSKFEYNSKTLLRDTRPVLVRFFDTAQEPFVAVFFLAAMAVFITLSDIGGQISDVVAFCGLFYFGWLMKQHVKGLYRTPKYFNKTGDGILYIGNQRKTNRELWVNNSDARTHILYLGTTGSGKTEGLKSLVSNALTWGSGFVYVDGKADTDLWASIYALARRFGREDDLMVLNYMTGNSDTTNVSNTMNPLSYGSASYLTNMMVGLMDDAGGDTAMWKGRAVSLMGALMPALTWKRDNEDVMLDVQVIRDHLGELKDLVALSRHKRLPDRIKKGLQGYLKTLPGYVDESFDDNGDEKPPGPGNPGADMTTPRQQHGYLTMQFTRSLQSLADEYGHIFRTQLADIDMMDVVLNRRIMLVLIPALEKSGDEAANLGKIVAANIKGMMGATLGSDVEGDWDAVIENKVTRSNSPFMTVFDEVGYYAAQGMAVMAAQARSLGFSLVFSAQDLPALEKRVKEEARSIAANCNIKIFGKLEDPTQTREFFENTVGGATISKISSFESSGGGGTSYSEQKGASVSDVKKATYGELRLQKEGEAHITFMADTLEARMFYANPKKVTAMRVGRYLRVEPQSVDAVLRDPAVDIIITNFKTPGFTALRAAPPPEAVPEFETLRRGWTLEDDPPADWIRAGALAVARLAHAQGIIKFTASEKGKDKDAGDEDDLAIDNLLAEFKASRAKQKPEAESVPAAAPSRPTAPPPVADDESDDLDFSRLTEKAKVPATDPAVSAQQTAENDTDDLDFSSLFGKEKSQASEDGEKNQTRGESDGGGPALSWKDFVPPEKAAEKTPESRPITSHVRAEMPTGPIPLPPDLDEELLPPDQTMTPFIADVMKRTGRALGDRLFGSQTAA